MKTVLINTIPLGGAIFLTNGLYFLSTLLCVRFFGEPGAAPIILLFYGHLVLVLFSDCGILAGNGYGVKYLAGGGAGRKKRCGDLIASSFLLTFLVLLVFYSLNSWIHIFPGLSELLVGKTLFYFLVLVLAHNICKVTMVVLNSFESGWGAAVSLVPVEIVRIVSLFRAAGGEEAFTTLLQTMALGYAAVNLFQIVFLAGYLKKRDCTPEFNNILSGCMTILRRSIFYYLPWLSIFILVPITNFFLASRGNMEEVTLFTVGSQFAAPVLLSVVPFNFALFPYLVRSPGRGIHITDREFRRIMVVLIAAVISYTLVIGGFGQAIYMFLAKREAPRVIAVALILLAGYSTDIFRCITDPILNMKNREKLVTVAELAKPASLITVLLVAGREYGALAGAAGLALGCLLASLIKAHGIRAISCYNFYWPMAGSFTAASLLCFLFFSL